MSHLTRFEEWVVTCLQVILQKCSLHLGVLLVGGKLAIQYHSLLILLYLSLVYIHTALARRIITIV